MDLWGLGNQFQSGNCSSGARCERLEGGRGEGRGSAGGGAQARLKRKGRGWSGRAGPRKGVRVQSGHAAEPLVPRWPSAQEGHA